MLFTITVNSFSVRLRHVKPSNHLALNLLRTFYFVTSACNVIAAPFRPNAHSDLGIKSTLC